MATFLRFPGFPDSRPAPESDFWGGPQIAPIDRCWPCPEFLLWYISTLITRPTLGTLVLESPGGMHKSDFSDHFYPLFLRIPGFLGRFLASPKPPMSPNRSVLGGQIDPLFQLWRSNRPTFPNFRQSRQKLSYRISWKFHEFLLFATWPTLPISGPSWGQIWANLAQT